MDFIDTSPKEPSMEVTITKLNISKRHNIFFALLQRRIYQIENIGPMYIHHKFFFKISCIEANISLIFTVTDWHDKYNCWQGPLQHYNTTLHPKVDQHTEIFIELQLFTTDLSE